MAELTHFYNENNTAATETAINFAAATDIVFIDGAALSASTKYLVVCRALIGSTSATDKILPRVAYDGTTIGFGGSSYEMLQTGTSDLLSWLFVHSFTTDSVQDGTKDIAFRCPVDGSTANIDQASLFVLDLDAIGTEGIDYFEDIQANDVGTEYSTSLATTVLAQLAGSDLGTDEYLILGDARVHVGSAGRYYTHPIYGAYDTSTPVLLALHRAEGEDTAELRLSGFAVRHKASSGTPNVTIYGEEEAASGNMTDGGAYLIALPTALFADFVDDRDDSTQVVDGTETTIATSGSYTPTTTGNHLIFGWANGIQEPTALGGMWVESTTTEIRTGDSTPTHNQIWDNAKDNEQMVTFQRYSITTAETFNLRAQGAGADFDVDNSWLIVVNLNPPSTGATSLPHKANRTMRHLLLR